MINTKHFKPKAHILRLLGNELIKSSVMAIYELVKNSYDADSRYVNVDFNHIGEKSKTIITVQDNGTGLTSDVIENVWLEPGTDHRKPFDKDGNRIIIRSPIYNRVPMGEKGVGRFAVHKLGDKIKLITRPAQIVFNNQGNPKKELLNYEITLIIDWRSFSQSKYLEDIPISWTTETDISKFHFKDDSGTLIEVTELKESWTRRMALGLKRNSVSMLSPKNDKSKFMINLNFGNNWLSDFPDAKKILDIAPYKYTALLDEDFNLIVDYEFSLAQNDTMGSRIINGDRINLKGRLRTLLRETLEEDLLTDEEIEKRLNILKDKKSPFGNIILEIYSYDLDSDSLKDYTYDAATLKKILKTHSGIKVFKDDMRIFNYGEPNNDWLEIDLKRVQSKKWFSNNQIIGYIYLDSSNSTKLVEKTNREGFVENEIYLLFFQSINEILENFRSERHKDRVKWLQFNKEESNTFNYGEQIDLFKYLVDTTDYNDEEKKNKLKLEADKLVNDLESKKDILLIPAGVGMTTSIAMHEIEKLVPRIREVVKSTPFKKKIAIEQVRELDEYLKGILSVLRKGGNKPIDVKKSINKALSNYSSKLIRRNIVTKMVIDDNVETINCDKRYFITMIMNIINNSIYWLDTIYKKHKGIYIRVLKENSNTSIVIVDNGPGFKDDISDIVMPFFSRKSDGIGLGLYLVDTLMMKYGKLEMIDSDQELDNLNIPVNYRGASVKLTFSKGQ